MNKTVAKQNTRMRRHARVRAKIKGTLERPRLAIYKSNRYMEAQLIDDEAGKTILSGKMADGIKLAADVAAKAKAKGVTKIVFDRGGFRYTGSVSAFAEALRKAGLEF
jgi:large subunit ribosomal protein L18